VGRRGPHPNGGSTARGCEGGSVPATGSSSGGNGGSDVLEHREVNPGGLRRGPKETDEEGMVELT
jgi:hypothetical protein